MLCVDDPYVAYCLDQAIGYWGRHIEGELESVDGDNERVIEAKRKAILDKYLHPGKEGAPAKGQFADPALMFS